MVFESISKSISNLGKWTVKSSRSVLKSTTKATRFMTDPLTWVAKKSIKYVPFVWNQMDIWELTHDHFALDLFTDDLKSSITTLLTVLRKWKVVASKVNLLKRSLNDVVWSLEHEVNLKHWEENVLRMLKKLSSIIGTSIDVTRKDEKWSVNKNIKLTATQLWLAKEELKKLEKHTRHTALELKNLISYISIKPTSSYQSKNVIKEWRKNNHNIVDDLITAKFDIVTQQKKIYYLLLELERRLIKSRTHKNSLTNTQIDDILKIKIPSHQNVIKELRSSINELEKNASKNRLDFDTKVTSWLNEVNEWLKTNVNNTNKSISAEKKEAKSEDKKLSALRKSYISSSNAIIIKSKSPFDKPDQLQKLITQESVSYGLLSEMIISRLSHTFSMYLSKVKDLELSHMLVNEHINREYDSILLNKEFSLHLWLLNRIQKKQVNAQEKIKLQIKKLKTMWWVKSIVWLDKRSKIESKSLINSIKSNDERRATIKTTVSDQHDIIKEWRKLNLLIDHKAKSIAASSEHAMKVNMIWYLTKDKKQIESSISSQLILANNIETTLKKSEIQLKENERSAFTLQDKARSKKATDFEKIVHAQELTLDSLEHHIDYEKDLLFLCKDQLSDYSSEIKKLLKKVNKEESYIKKLSKELKKNKLAKKII